MTDFRLPYTIPGGQQIQFTPFSLRGRVGGDAEVIGSGAISSENYVVDSTGWRIDGEGNAEFNDVSVRGTLVTNGGVDDHIQIGTAPFESRILFYNGGATEIDPAAAVSIYAGVEGLMQIYGPDHHAATDPGLISLTMNSSGVRRFVVDKFDVVANTEDPEQGTVTWQNTWADFGGNFSVNCWKDFNGFVHLEGLARNSNGGVADPANYANILLLPTGYRPPSEHRIFACLEQGGTIVRVDVNTTGYVTITATPGGSVANGQWINLQPITFYAGW